MNVKNILSFLILILLGACAKQEKQQEVNFESQISQKVIYGEDNRKDWFEVQNEAHIELARSTAGLIDRDDLMPQGESTRVRLSSSLNLCPEERFTGQKTGPWCSGFLVGPDLMLTAGHCIRSQYKCEDTSFIFDFALETPTQSLSQIPSENVYHCKELIGQVLESRGADWALVRVDRPVTGRSVLKIRREGKPEINTPLLLIGHPSGLPSKISNGGQVRNYGSGYLVADVDSYGGNSGSAVFNSITHEIEGILVRGRNDYGRDPRGCKVSNYCEEGINGSCTERPGSIEAEHITQISEVADLIPEVSEGEQEESPQDEQEDEQPSQEDGFVSSLILPIPMSNFQDTTSTIRNVPAMNHLSDLKIAVEIEHSYIGDLRIKLVAPNKKSILLHNKSGRGAHNIVGTYGFDLQPYESFLNLGEQPQGDWQLIIEDHVLYDDGQLIKWEIIL